MKASIIIPAYNEEKKIAATLKSIYAQSYKDIEVIVVCNGCKDKTAITAKKYTLNVIELRKPGVSKARNEGAKIAKGEILIFIDADSIMEKTLVEKAVAAINKGFVGGTVMTKPIEASKKARFMWWLKDKANFFFLTASGILFCKKEAFPGFREDVNLAEDTFLIDALRKKGSFAYLRNTYIQTSMRRYEKMGYLNTILTVTKGYFQKKIHSYAPVR